MNVGSTTYLAISSGGKIRIYNRNVEDDGINPNASGLTASLQDIALWPQLFIFSPNVKQFLLVAP